MSCQNRQRASQLRHLPAHRLQSYPEGPGKGFRPPSEKNRWVGRRVSRKPNRRVIKFTRFPWLEYDLVVTTDWAGIATGLGNGQADVAWKGPRGFVLANKEGHAHA